MRIFLCFPVVVVMFALAATLAGVRGASVGQHIGSAFFIGGTSMIASAFIFGYFNETCVVGGVLAAFVLSILAAWLISYLLANLIYVVDEHEAARFSTITSLCFAIGFLIWALSLP